MFKKSLILISTILIFVGCSSDGSDATAATTDSTTSTTTDSTSDISGKAADGYLAGATVFLDKNGNKELDGDEPSTTTDSTGAYKLKVSQTDLNQYPIVVKVDENTVDLDTNNPVGGTYTLESPIGNEGFISPLTDFIQQQLALNPGMSKKDLETLIFNAMGSNSNEGEMFTDYIKNASNVNQEILHKVAQKLATIQMDNANKMSQYRGAAKLALGKLIKNNLKKIMYSSVANIDYNTTDTTLTNGMVNIARIEAASVDAQTSRTMNSIVGSKFYVIDGENDLYVDEITFESNNTLIVKRQLLSNCDTALSDIGFDSINDYNQTFSYTLNDSNITITGDYFTSNYTTVFNQQIVNSLTEIDLYQSIQNQGSIPTMTQEEKDAMLSILDISAFVNFTSGDKLIKANVEYDITDYSSLNNGTGIGSSYFHNAYTDNYNSIIDFINRKSWDDSYLGQLSGAIATANCLLNYPNDGNGNTFPFIAFFNPNTNDNNATGTLVHYFPDENKTVEIGSYSTFNEGGKEYVKYPSMFSSDNNQVAVLEGTNVYSRYLTKDGYQTQRALMNVSAVKKMIDFIKANNIQ
jgi:hypothetical protein